MPDRVCIWSERGAIACLCLAGTGTVHATIVLAVARCGGCWEPDVRLHEQVDLEEVQKAFRTLGASQPGLVLPGDRFVDAMTSLGEVMDTDELTEALRLLTGKDSIAEALPAKLTPSSFSELLGFDSAAA